MPASLVYTAVHTIKRQARAWTTSPTRRPPYEQR